MDRRRRHRRLPPAPAPAAAPAPPPPQPSYTDQIDREQLRKLVWGQRGTQPSSPWDRTTAETMSARWRSNLYGFVELNAMHDSTQSYGPSSNNAMLARPGTYAAFHGRTQFTANNSLFGFMLKAPDWGRLRTFGHVEVDFFGVQPSDALEQHGLHDALRAHAPVLLPAAARLLHARARSICWSASTTTCSRGAAPASTRTASRSSGSRARSITATRRSAGRCRSRFAA